MGASFFVPSGYLVSRLFLRPATDSAAPLPLLPLSLDQAGKGIGKTFVALAQFAASPYTFFHPSFEASGNRQENMKGFDN